MWHCINKNTICCRFYGLITCVTDFMDWDTICDKFYGLRYYMWQIPWTEILYVADSMDWETICGRFHGLRYYMWQILWTEILYVADFMDWELRYYLADFIDCDTKWGRFYWLITVRCNTFKQFNIQFWNLSNLLQAKPIKLESTFAFIVRIERNNQWILDWIKY